MNLENSVLNTTTDIASAKLKVHLIGDFCLRFNLTRVRSTSRCCSQNNEW